MPPINMNLFKMGGEQTPRGGSGTEEGVGGGQGGEGGDAQNILQEKIILILFELFRFLLNSGQNGEHSFKVKKTVIFFNFLLFG